MGKILRESIATFVGLHHEKRKLYTLKQFKNAAPKATIYNMDIEPIIKFFETFNPKIRTELKGPSWGLVGCRGANF